MSREQTALPFASRATEGSELDSLVRHAFFTRKMWSEHAVHVELPRRLVLRIRRSKESIADPASKKNRTAKPQTLPVLPDDASGFLGP
jgi:hypothetical protein